MKQEGKRRRYSYNCSFCGRSQDQAQRLIAGPGFVYICDECIDFIYSGDGTYLEGKSMFYLPVQAADKREQRCSFCGKVQHDVRYIAAKAQTDRHICNECIDLCREIIEEEQRTITQRPDSTTEGS